MYTIPVTSDPNQSFRCTVPIDGANRPLVFGFRYNSEAGYWTMAVTDGVTGVLMIDSLALRAGVHPSANLLDQYSFLRIGSAALVKINPDAPGYGPDENGLGTDFILVWGDTDMGGW